MNAGEFAKRRARIEQEAWRRRGGYLSKAMAALIREARAALVIVDGKHVAWKLPNGQAVCRKQRFPSELDATTALSSVQRCPRTGKIPHRVYQCPWCDGWHLTSQNRQNYQ